MTSLKKNLQWDTQQSDSQLIVYLTGELTRNTLLPLWEQRASFLSPMKDQPICWDFSALMRVDSAGFILLCELLHHYQRHNPNYLIHLPKSVVALAELFDLEDWISSFLFSDQPK